MFQFEGYTLDVGRSSLRTADRDIQLRPKAFEVLRYLVENADCLVAKEELIQAIWPNVTVTDEALAHCVSEARQAIGDGGQAIIKTLPRRGYRFAAPVVRVAASTRAPSSSPLVGEGRGGGARDHGPTAPYSPTPTPDPSPAATSRTRVSATQVSDRNRQQPISIGGGEEAAGPLRAPPAQSDSGPQSRSPLLDQPSVAVLPFPNLSGDPQQDYFSDGITEDITTELSRFSELLVIACNSSFQYKGKRVDIRQIGRELNARYVLEGSVRRSGDRIRITAQLIDAATGAHRWAERYDRELRDAFAVQDEVARAIVAILVAHVNRAEIDRTLLKPPAAWEAYEYYLRGAEAFLLHVTRRTTASLYDARRMLEQSLAIDPTYARAYAMLSRTHLTSYAEPFDGDYLSPAALDRALELAETAVHLDDRLPQAHAQLGDILLFKRQHDAAIAEFERAFALNPNFIDYRYARALINVGDPARAIEVLEANLRFDPFQPLIYSTSWLAFPNYTLNRYGHAVRLLRECASRLPNLQWPHVWLASAYAQAGQPEEARKAS